MLSFSFFSQVVGMKEYFIFCAVIAVTCAAREFETNDLKCNEPMNRDVPACNWRYLAYFPHEFTTGADENVVISIHGYERPVEVNITLFDRKIQFLQNTFNIQPGILNTLPLYIPHNAPRSVRLVLDGRGEEINGTVWTFKNSTNYIRVRKLGLKIFAQTDRPIYKPGQTIKFRVVVVDTDMKPYKGTLDNVKIENPSGTLMQQWIDTQLSEGFASFELQTSEKPVMGKWKIIIKMASYMEELEIEVKKFVLPKFQVTLTPPSFIARPQQNFQTEVCAKYSYGKNVMGKLTLKICKIRSYYYRGNDNNDNRCITVTKNVYGCTTLKTNLKEAFGKQQKYRSWYRPRFVFSAVVKELATGQEMKSEEKSKDMVRNAISLSVEGSEVFKPGFPFTVTIVAKYVDGSPVDSVLVKITAGSDGYGSTNLVNKEQFISNGVYKVAMPPIPFNARSIDIKATYKRPTISGLNETEWERTTTATKSISPWYSPSHSYLFIQKPNQPFNHGTKAELTIGYTSISAQEQEKTIYYSLMCSGNIQQSGSFKTTFIAATPTNPTTQAPTTTNAPTTNAPTTYTQNKTNAPNSTGKYAPPLPTFTTHKYFTNRDPFAPVTRPPLPPQYSKGSFRLTFDVTPAMMPLCRVVVYYLNGHEVVADNTDVKIVKEFNNKVSMEFSKEEVKPGDQVKLLIRGAPNSRVAVTAIDKSIHFLKKGNDIKPEHLFKVRDELDIGQAYKRYRQCSEYYGKRKRRSIYPGYWGNEDYVDSEAAFDGVGVKVMSSLSIDVRPCNDNLQIAAIADELDVRPCKYTPIAQPMAVDSVVGNNGGGGIRRIGGGGVVGKRKGKQKSETRVRKDFPETWIWEDGQMSSTGEHVIDVKVPDTITSWYASAFAVSSQAGLGVASPTQLNVFQPFFVSLVLPYSVIRGEVVTVPAAVFSYLDDVCVSMRVELASSPEYKMVAGPAASACLCGGRTVKVLFKVQPHKIGDISLRVSASTQQKNLCKGAYDDTVTAADILVKKLKVEPEGVKQEYTKSSFVCLNNTEEKIDFNLTLPANTVKDSVHTKMLVVGDVMGSSLENIDELLSIPYGCGEQNMLKFAPNIFIMNYMRNTNQKNDDLKKLAVNYMLTGYQRELTYKRDDGSYSAFGQRDPEGSTWLTAFVLKSYAQAQSWIDIDKNEIQHITNWLFKNQDRDGCFPRIGKLHNKAMQGGVGSPVTLTAYVLVSLLEAGIQPNHHSILNAQKCVTSSLENIKDSYSLSLIAYMYAKMGSVAQYQQTLDRLYELAVREDGMAHWEEKQEASDKKKQVPWYYQARSTDIEQTAYVMLAILAHKKQQGVNDVVSIVQWLSKQRNSLGGWSSTQDTVLAMQALSEFAEFSYQASGDMQLEMTSSRGDQHTFSINQENKIVSQRVEGIEVKKNAPTQVKLKTSGEGCALVTTSVLYNIETVVEAPTFEAIVSIVPIVGSLTKRKSCRSQLIKVCVSYSGAEDELDTTNMAILDVQMISGFIPNQDSLDELMNNNLIGSSLDIKEIDVKDKNVIFYFDQIRKSETCVKFRVDQTSVVRKTKPAVIKVYDYYDTEKSTTQLYEFTKAQCIAK